MKKGDLNSALKERYFVLYRSKLIYFKKQKVKVVFAVVLIICSMNCKNVLEKSKKTKVLEKLI